MCGMWLGAWNHDNLTRNVVCECYVWMERGDESGQARLLTFSTISSRSMRELGSGSFIKIVFLDVI
jgi:hypothetical protein